jgi:hypothetical protein
MTEQPDHRPAGTFTEWEYTEEQNPTDARIHELERGGWNFLQKIEGRWLFYRPKRKIGPQEFK